MFRKNYFFILIFLPLLELRKKRIRFRPLRLAGIRFLSFPKFPLFLSKLQPMMLVTCVYKAP